MVKVQKAVVLGGSSPMLTRCASKVVLGNVDDSLELKWRALYMFVHYSM
jgi:hypothetical protein